MKKEYERAKQYLLDAKDNGRNEVILLLGRMYEDYGQINEAIKWYENGIKENVIRCIPPLIRILKKNDSEDKVDWWIHWIIENKDLDHLKLVINILSELEDKDRVVFCLEKAAQMGDVEALASLGMIAFGEGNVEKSIDLLKQAIKNGLEETRVNLGVILIESGRKEEGMNELEKAAMKGNPEAKFNLGLYLIDESPFMALKWLEEAYEGGISEAQGIIEQLHLEIERAYQKKGKNSEKN